MPRRVIKKVTQFDIARRIGVSHAAVSMALRGSHEVGKEQAEKIREMAKKLGYYPKIAAQMLRSGRTGYLGIVMAGSSLDVIAEIGFGGMILAHFLAQCQASSIPNNIEFFQSSAGGSFTPPHSLTGGLVDGVILAGFVDEKLREWLAGQPRYPWVSIDEPAPHSVLCASDRGVVEAVSRLAVAGHRQIGFWGGPTRYNTHRLEAEGFRRAVAEFGMNTGGGRWVKKIDAADANSGDSKLIAQWAHDILRATPRPTAFVCHGPAAARELIMAALRLGLEVPDDLSIYCFCARTEALSVTPHLSSIEVDFPTMLSEGISMLQALTGSRSLAPRTVSFPPSVVDRDSVARLR